MKDYIRNFPNQIKKACEIATKIDLGDKFNDINNIVISGQGGSGIGGVIAKNLLQPYCSIPIIINQDYKIPAFVNEKTLFISSSYSGNTEETLVALEKALNKNSQIVCITSSGKLLEKARSNNLSHIILPSGFAPRVMLSFSVIQILCVIKMVLDKKQSLNEVLIELNQIQEKITSFQEIMIATAKEIVLKMDNKMPFIYTFPEFEGLALRFKQQLNENSKRHAVYNIIPEMNHNEIVAWNKKNLCSIAFFIDLNETSQQNKKRMQINKSQISKYVEEVIELNSDMIKLNSVSTLFEYFYFIHIIDWISFFLAERDGVDPNTIEPIDFLKNELKKT